MASTSLLTRTIGFGAATALITGSVIGSGVFMKPSSMADQLHSPVWLSLVWVIAGLFSLAGAFIYAELGAMMPETGGLYVYFRRMFGEFFAFLYGWSAFAVINTAAVAAIGFVCAEYADHFLHLPRFDPAVEHSIAWNIPFIGVLYPLENAGVKSLASLIIIFFTWLNYRSVKAGSRFQLMSTVVKIAALGALVFGIFFSGEGNAANFTTASEPKQGMDLLTGIMLAMTGAFFAYDGWVNITFVAGEIREPKRNLPRSLVIGVFGTIIVYLLVNQAYLYVLPVNEIASSELVAADAIGRAWGTMGENIIAAMIVVCTLGAVNGNVMASPRVTYAMSKDGVFFPWAGKDHTKFRTPGNALWLHGIWTILFIITGSFNMLADMFVFVTWIAYMFGAIGVMMLRKKMKDAERPYKTPLYPWLPIVFIVFTAFYLVITVVSDVSNYINDKQPVINSLLGMALVFIGVPIYYLCKQMRSNPKTQ